MTFFRIFKDIIMDPGHLNIGLRALSSLNTYRLVGQRGGVLHGSGGSLHRGHQFLTSILVSHKEKCIDLGVIHAGGGVWGPPYAAPPPPHT